MLNTYIGASKNDHCNWSDHHLNRQKSTVSSSKRLGEWYGTSAKVADQDEWIGVMIDGHHSKLTSKGYGIALCEVRKLSEYYISSSCPSWPLLVMYCNIDTNPKVYRPAWLSIL